MDSKKLSNKEIEQRIAANRLRVRGDIEAIREGGSYISSTVKEISSSPISHLGGAIANNFSSKETLRKVGDNSLLLLGGAAAIAGLFLWKGKNLIRKDTLQGNEVIKTIKDEGTSILNDIAKRFMSNLRANIFNSPW